MDSTKELDRRAFWAETSIFRTAHKPFEGPKREGFKDQQLVDFTMARYLVAREQIAKKELQRQVDVKDECITALEIEIDTLQKNNRILREKDTVSSDRAREFERAHSCALSSLAQALSNQRAAEETVRSMRAYTVTLNEKLKAAAIDRGECVSRVRFAQEVGKKERAIDRQRTAERTAAQYWSTLTQANYDKQKFEVRLEGMKRINDTHQKANGVLRTELTRAEHNNKRHCGRIDSLLKERSEAAAVRAANASYGTPAKNLTATEVLARQSPTTAGRVKEASDDYLDKEVYAAVYGLPMAQLVAKTWREVSFSTVWDAALLEDVARAQAKADELKKHNAEQQALADTDLAKYGVSVMHTDKDGRHHAAPIEAPYAKVQWKGGYSSIFR
jgi:hypothetical protein